MEGSSGKLFNHDHANGIRVTVQNVDRANGNITFYMDPDGDELNLNRNNEQGVRNDEQLQANHDQYFVDWDIQLENNPPSPVSTLPPGSPGVNSNISNNESINNANNNSNNNNNNGAHGVGGKRKRKSKSRARKTRKSKKTRRSRK